MGGDDTWVRGLELLWIWVQVLVGRHELTLVVGATVTNYDLRWVLVWHYYRWLRQSASESIRMIRFQWFLEHACVQVISDLELVLGQGRYFWQSLWIQIDWLGRSISECKAYVVTILLEDFAAGYNLSVLEHSSRACPFGFKLIQSFLHSLILSGSHCLLFLFLFFDLLLWCCHILELIFKY